MGVCDYFVTPNSNKHCDTVLYVIKLLINRNSNYTSPAGRSKTKQKRQCSNISNRETTKVIMLHVCHSVSRHTIFFFNSKSCNIV